MATGMANRNPTWGKFQVSLEKTWFCWFCYVKLPGVSRIFCCTSQWKGRRCWPPFVQAAQAVAPGCEERLALSSPEKIFCTGKKHGKMVENIGKYGKHMGKTWETYGKHMGNNGEKHGKRWKDKDILWEYHRILMGIYHNGILYWNINGYNRR